MQPEDKPSNGVAGYNSTSINVCYIGGVDKRGRAVDNRTEAQKEALATILKDLHSRYPDAEILGHRDIWGPNPIKWKKMCPCFDVKQWWNEILAADEIPTVSEESTEVVLDQPSVESGEVVVPWNKEQVPEQPVNRPNPIDFVI